MCTGGVTSSDGTIGGGSPERPGHGLVYTEEAMEEGRIA